MTKFLRDINGNPLLGGDAGFTTSSLSDGSVPTIVKTNPPDAFTGVPVNLMVQIQFNESVRGSSIGTVTLTPSGGSPLILARSLSDANRILTLAPSTLLLPSKLYTLSISGIVDTAGNAASPSSRTFTTGPGAALSAPLLTGTAPGTAPALNDINVAPAAAPSATFAAPVNPVSVKTSSLHVYLVSSGQPVAGTASVSADGKTMIFTPAATLGANTFYGFYMSGVTDMAGDTLAPFDISFATGN